MKKQNKKQQQENKKEKGKMSQYKRMGGEGEGKEGKREKRK